MAGLATLKSALGATSFSPNGLGSLDSWLAALTQPASLIELAAIAVCVGLSWLGVRALSRRRRLPNASSVWFGERIGDGVLFPLLLLMLAFAAQELLKSFFTLVVFKVAIPIVLALALIRLGVKVLQVAYKNAPLVRALERTISWVIWLGLALWLTGLLPLMLQELDNIEWKVGESYLSLRTMLEGAFTAGVVLLIALWISAAIEARLLRTASGGDLSLRKAASNAARVVLMFVGLLLAVSAVGIDLTALSVLGGAIGVGVGLGLQKLVSNYVSGFVILAERSVRIGDNVKVDIFEGRITDIRARYTVVRAINGRDAIVPNEMFINNRVENLSSFDTRTMLTTAVTVSFDSQPDQVLRLLLDAAQRQPRVIADPPAAANLTALGPDGLQFTLEYWIADAENGQQNLRSLVNLDVLASLRSQGIAIAFPQRVIHSAGAADPSAPPGLRQIASARAPVGSAGAAGSSSGGSGASGGSIGI
jgi:small-conductance mechanosensitive channel